MPDPTQAPEAPSAGHYNLMNPRSSPQALVSIDQTRYQYGSGVNSWSPENGEMQLLSLVIGIKGCLQHSLRHIRIMMLSAVLLEQRHNLNLMRHNVTQNLEKKYDAFSCYWHYTGSRIWSRDHGSYSKKSSTSRHHFLHEYVSHISDDRESLKKSNSYTLFSESISPYISQITWIRPRKCCCLGASCSTAQVFSSIRTRIL